MRATRQESIAPHFITLNLNHVKVMIADGAKYTGSKSFLGFAKHVCDPIVANSAARVGETSSS